MGIWMLIPWSKRHSNGRELRGSGLGYLKIAGILNDEKRPTKRGAPWQSMSVRSVLRSAEKVVSA
jgi:hypothetical protein